MTNEELGTLAYAKSPKLSKRTTFQDELQAAVSARANKVMKDQYSDDFDDEDDDFLDLLKSRKKKINAFKSSKAKTVNFELSDEEDKPAKSKRVSFLKTERSGSSLEVSQADASLSTSVDDSGDQGLFVSTAESPDKRSDEESLYIQNRQESTTPVSEGALKDTPEPLPTDSREPSPNSPTLNMTGTLSPSKQLTENILPTPKPRQRVMAVNNYSHDKLSAAQDLNMPLAPTRELLNQCNTHNLSEGAQDTISSSRSQSLSSMGDHSLLIKSLQDSESKNDLNAEHSGDPGLPFEDLSISHPSTTQESVDQIDCTNNDNLHVSEDTCETRTSVSCPKGSSKALGAKVVKSKYLGSLSVLDRTVSLQDTELQADSLRAAVYQEWLRKKKENMKQNLERKKKDEIIREKTKKNQEAKKEDACASYEAWKQKKMQSMKIKTKEQQDKTRKAEKAKEEIEEKKQAAKQVFEKWKRERDILLKEKYRKARKDESEQQLQKQETEEERRKNNHSAFLEWSEKKKILLQERAIAKHKEYKDNTKTEQYLKEEKDKMALDMYENWLARKNREKKHHQEQKWLQGILHESPPPPWSPPNKTISHGK